MRISAIFKIVGQTLPLDYRSGFISLLKTSYKLASPDIFYSSIYETNSLKPFTFSVYFGNKSKVQDNKIFINTDTIILNFSTYSLEYATYFYNGLLKIKKELKEYPLFDTHISLKNIYIKKEVQIKDNLIIFKTLSPFFVRDYKDKNKYLTPKDKKFIDQLNWIVSECSKIFLDRKESIEFKEIKTNIKPPILHYGVPMDGIKGVFSLKGNPEILDLIYKIGLGSRRSQGFGMLEVVK